MMATPTLARTALFAVLVFAACTPSDPAPTQQGEQLARTHCASCHRFPEPALLNRASWNAVLPNMGARLGVYATFSRDSLVASTNWYDVDPASIYPPNPVLTRDEWDALVAYYTDEAPEDLPPQPAKPEVTVGLSDFKVREVETTFEPPLTTMVQIEDSVDVSLVGNYAQESALAVLDPRGQVLHYFKLDGPPVAASMDGARLLIAVVGPGPEPTEASAGSVQVVAGPNAPPQPLITGLKRPVDMDLGDVNGDGRQDLVLCEFGNQTGFLSWYEATADGTYRRHVLSDRPGAVEAALHDFDGDGRLDIAALMAQGDEGIDLYYNQGGGRFEARRVLRFPPVYGSNFFELVDFNADGRMDILYANGDNADATPVLKNYHGVRIFLSEPDGTFREHTFFPLHGAIAARAADFDDDGDLDVAAIAFFPDYEHTPEESFVLLKNKGDLTFEASTFQASYRGRWIAMDVGDFDRDRDPDILLGSNVGFAPQGDTTGLYQKWMSAGSSFVVLENAPSAHARQQVEE